ncbi:nascent polypeptide-associated complex subunit alpha, muscle-specific form-like [Lemur catta]|uniref:nascent polypeptide-associated complex subunit alpha, muscle-specific form-like n=1 Tax=Lemur catta TaxID=9447 RepID=UPI001E26BCEC|nr:nascent polypeptide-associated complex subunit alpha, muscle-specific form-like [Lemur catta]
MQDNRGSVSGQHQRSAQAVAAVGLRLLWAAVRLVSRAGGHPHACVADGDGELQKGWGTCPRSHHLEVPGKPRSGLFQTPALESQQLGWQAVRAELGRRARVERREEPQLDGKGRAGRIWSSEVTRVWCEGALSATLMLPVFALAASVLQCARNPPVPRKPNGGFALGDPEAGRGGSPTGTLTTLRPEFLPGRRLSTSAGGLPSPPLTESRLQRVSARRVLCFLRFLPPASHTRGSSPGQAQPIPQGSPLSCPHGPPGPQGDPHVAPWTALPPPPPPGACGGAPLTVPHHPAPTVFLLPQEQPLRSPGSCPSHPCSSAWPPFCQLPQLPMGLFHCPSPLLSLSPVVTPLAPGPGPGTQQGRLESWRLCSWSYSYRMKAWTPSSSATVSSHQDNSSQPPGRSPQDSRVRQQQGPGPLSSTRERTPLVSASAGHFHCKAAAGSTSSLLSLGPVGSRFGHLGHFPRCSTRSPVGMFGERGSICVQETPAHPGEQTAGGGCKVGGLRPLSARSPKDTFSL